MSPNCQSRATFQDYVQSHGQRSMYNIRFQILSFSYLTLILAIYFFENHWETLEKLTAPVTASFRKYSLIDDIPYLDEAQVPPTHAIPTTPPRSFSEHRKT